LTFRRLPTAFLLTFLALLFRAPMFCGGLEVWNTTGVTAVQAGRFGWRLFAAVRTRSHFTHAYDFRAGSELSVELSPRFSFTAGYLRRRLDPSNSSPHWENRVYGTPSWILSSRPLLINLVAVFEHNFGIPGAPAYNRYRPRLELEKKRQRFSPFLAEEFTFRREGFVRSRTAAGVRWRSESGVTVEVAYQFDTAKSGNAWIPRHAIRSALNFGSLFHQH
jgi:hypothetical protein